MVGMKNQNQNQKSKATGILFSTLSLTHFLLFDDEFHHEYYVDTLYLESCIHPMIKSISERVLKGIYC